MRRHEIPEEHWARIEGLLPGRPGGHGGVARDNRNFINAVWYVAKTGIPWRDLPERFGKWDTVYHRFNEWCKKGVWQRILAVVQDADITHAEALLADHEPQAVLGDKGYDSDAFVATVESRGAQAVIPPRKNRVAPRDYDQVVYKERNKVERCVNALKQCRRVATRYEKTARNFLGMVLLAAITIWLK